MKTCLYCGKELTLEQQRRNKYCSQACAKNAQRDTKINAWLSGESSGGDY